MAEMTALEYFKTKARMGNAGKDGYCTKSCSNCALILKNNGKFMTCSVFEKLCPERAISIIQKWSEEHPVKTMKDDFFEKFPNAPKSPTGIPFCCPYNCGYTSYHCNSDSSCFDCWNRPLEVE